MAEEGAEELTHGFNRPVFEPLYVKPRVREVRLVSYGTISGVPF